MLTVGDRFPQFRCRACCGIEDTDLVDVTQETFAGLWRIFAFYPKDFSELCPQELIELGRAVPLLERWQCVILACSTDSDTSHLAWRRSHDALKSLAIPMLSAGVLARDVGVLNNSDGMCMRASVVIDPDDVIRHISVHDRKIGRNVTDLVRTVKALQSGEDCPCPFDESA